ncbi:B12-binding domain-containing radical SAM protein [Parachitinimonas caeni]|uniref:Radical SAM protein n=1 Tax=Parachitinimonas caeni TaxID=3031301 RepID=A0ABT7E3K9_9NEIS|nr:radical SAM protein [Parachitinimonas caeni]MDK2126903.1 radical SAM protein [Parachitinimonas caeni]
MTRFKVMIITGGLISEKDSSFGHALYKQLLQWRSSEHAWLDLAIKLAIGEPLVRARLARRLARHASWKPTVEAFFAQSDNLHTPELTEVLLATLLQQSGLAFDTLSYADLFSQPKQAAAKLVDCTAIFASTTLLRDLAEVEVVVQRLRPSGKPIILGGALLGSLHPDWQDLDGVDTLAIGYGEYLIPALADYIRSGFTQLVPPLGGRLQQRGRTKLLFSGLPAGRSLDALPEADWRLAGRPLRMVYYESVRGCPYRCSFCNYPYLFEDERFRYKSAERMADDWQRLREQLGVEFVTCLDSLFTLPRRRLTAFCEALIRRNVGMRWICYARADDLADRHIVQLMQAAGAHQVQIGIESGVQSQLDNMNKRCTVAANRQALDNCRELGLTSVVSLIVGYPGETADTLQQTYALLAETRPDFYFLATFSTRIADVPVLSPFNRARFGLRTSDDRRTTAPYWAHRSMDCREAVGHARALHRQIMQAGISLNAALFYPGMLDYHASQRADLLAFQREAISTHTWAAGLLDLGWNWVDRRLAADLAQHLAPAEDTPIIIPIQARP